MAGRARVHAVVVALTRMPLQLTFSSLIQLSPTGSQTDHDAVRAATTTAPYATKPTLEVGAVSTPYLGLTLRRQ